MAKTKKVTNPGAEAWKEANYKYIDVIVSSGKIRREFFQRCKDLEIDPVKVAIKANISPRQFKLNYIDNPEPVCTRSFAQEKFIKMLSFVGIEIKVGVILKPYSETYVELRKKGILKDE